MPSVVRRTLVTTLMVLALAAHGTTAAQESRQEPVRLAIEQLGRMLPAEADQWSSIDTGTVFDAIASVDRTSEQVWPSERSRDPATILRRIDSLSTSSDSLDALLQTVFEQRGDFARLEPAETRERAVCGFLLCTSKLIDLSGRLRYMLANSIEDAAFRFASRPDLREELIDQLIVLRSGIGASIMSWALIDPPPDSPNRAQPASPETKAKLLAMISWSGRCDTLPVIAAFLRSGRATPELTVLAAETVRRLGLPQDPRPGGDPKLPPPPITAQELNTILGKLPLRTLSRDLARRRDTLRRWLDSRIKHGLDEDGYQWGRYRIQPGDWLLMRNSSPYNLFTNLSPGLFTHVSVVAMERDPNGVRRMVVVEVAEQGARVPANNVESVLNVPLYYAFLRHDDPAVASTMGRVAASLIGHEFEYDLSFDLGLVAALRNRSLDGQKIKTYCAGLPLLCAQETSRPRSEFFPIQEAPAGGRTVENLNKLGIRLGAELVSPTGAVFSKHMRIVGRSEHVYAPGREIEQSIYDHLAESFRTKQLVPTGNLLQSLRLRLADASRTRPVLAQALARAAGVSADMDLVAAAKTQAVIESLNEIALGNSSQFLAAIEAVYGESPEEMAKSGRTKSDIDRITALRARHDDLRQQVEQGRLSPRQVRDALVSYYSELGKRQVDERFFPGDLSNGSGN